MLPPTVFSAAGRDFTIDDVLLAARACGDLVPIEAETAEALACARYAEGELWDREAVRGRKTEDRSAESPRCEARLIVLGKQRRLLPREDHGQAVLRVADHHHLRVRALRNLDLPAKPFRMAPNR
jgi:hypothetical protein